MELALNQGIIDFITYYIRNEYAILFLLSLLPITELRLSIPIGILYFKLSWVYVFIICVASNALAGVFLVLALGKIIFICNRIPFLRSVLKRLMVLSEDRYSKYSRYKSRALILFVGIPLPGTGAWTGSLVSHVLGLSKTSSILAIIQGVIISGVIMTVLSVTGKIIIG
jgi:uncharacterized membrane protein